MVPNNLSMWLFFCRFPGATSDDERDKRRTGVVGSSGSAVGPRSSSGDDGIDPDRVYFGTRKTAAVRTFRGQGLQALWEGKRRRRRQVAFHKSKPLEPSSAAHSIGVVSECVIQSSSDSSFHFMALP